MMHILPWCCPHWIIMMRSCSVIPTLPWCCPHWIEMLRDADFTLMLSTLDKHDAEILNDANFTLICPHWIIMWRCSVMLTLPWRCPHWIIMMCRRSVMLTLPWCCPHWSTAGPAWLPPCSCRSTGCSTETAPPAAGSSELCTPAGRQSPVKMLQMKGIPHPPKPPSFQTTANKKI